MSRNKISVIRIIILSAMLGLLPQLVMGTPPPFYQEYNMIEEIAKDTSTPEKKAKVVAELIGIVKDKGKDIHLRQFAAAKLGELGAVEAKDMLKALAESLKWNDSTRYLKGAVTLAYWKIKVAEEPNEPAQERLLIKLLRGGPPPYAGVVASWAVDELANRGVEKALPAIIKSIRHMNPTERGEEHIRLCKTKIELLNTSASRHEALTKALLMEDPTQYQRLRSWAIKELGKLKTEESRTILMYYALELQNKCYDKDDKWIGQKGDRLAAYAGEFYHTIIKILKKTGITDAEIKATGLRPDKFFISP